MKELIGQSVLIIGYGREGQSVARFIKTHYPEFSITVADKNPEAVKLSPYPTFSGNTYLSHLSEFDTVIHSPGIAATQIPILPGQHLTTATNLFFSHCRGRIIGVTGTKGKSTTSALIAHLFKTHGFKTELIGNIGTPGLDLLDQINHPGTHFVHELSSYQLSDIHYSPHQAVILPISEEHLNYHGSYTAYVQAKSHIVKFQDPDSVVVYYQHSPDSQKIATLSPGQKYPYPTLNLLSFTQTCSTQLLGRGNLENIMAATQIAIINGISLDTIRQGIATFKPLAHRLEPIGTYRGISFYNDSLATTPVATKLAFEALGSSVTTLIAGGYDRGLDMAVMAAVLAATNLKTLILLPDTGSKIISALNAQYPNFKAQIIQVDSMADAVKAAYLNTQAGEVCLLSPGATSYNLFRDYADRGDQFKNWVIKLGHE